MQAAQNPQDPERPKIQENQEPYNTVTATVICEWDNGHPMKDFRFHETLYRDKHGRFVLVGSGGRMSPYGVRCYDEHYIEGEVCRQIKNIELLNWLMLRGLEEKIAECFPNLDQGDFSCPFTT